MTKPFAFRARVIEWRGPSPYFYAPVPAPHVEAIRRGAKLVSYGWGVIPVEVQIGTATFTTSLFPKDGTYLLPLKAMVRRQCGITAGDLVEVRMELQARR